MRSLWLLPLIVCGCGGPLPDVCDANTSRTPTPLSQEDGAAAQQFAHAHNDYEHEHPLEDALGQKFRSVEADIYYSDGLFEVSHLGFGAKGALKALYLDPLQKKVDENGSVLGDGQSFALWLDLKDSNSHFGDALEALLEKYPMLTLVDGDSVTPGAVTVILTGDAKMKEQFVSKHPKRHAFRDRNDFSPADPPATTGWRYYALDWGAYLDWNGSGTIPAEQSERLACIVNRAHQNGYAVRFYGTPDNEAVWKASVEHGVDFINSDHLAELNAFLSK